MIWGQTGTRHGATHRQLASVAWLWAKYGITELHDGDCKGVDAQLYYLARVFGVGDHAITIHPPTNPKNRAWCGYDGNGEHSVTMRPEKPYFVRDRDIVDESQAIGGLPYKPFEEDHGGTWYTINYTRKQEKPLAIVWPNGHISYENWDLVES